MKAQITRWLRVLGWMIAALALLAFVPAPIRGHWIDPGYWSFRGKPVFITYVDGRVVAFFGDETPHLLGTYVRSGLRYVEEDRVAKCQALAYATPLFIFYARIGKNDSFILTRDFRYWMPHPKVSDVATMQVRTPFAPIQAVEPTRALSGARSSP